MASKSSIKSKDYYCDLCSGNEFLFHRTNFFVHETYSPEVRRCFLLSLQNCFEATYMLERCFIVVISLMIALQSLASIAEVEQGHHSDASGLEQTQPVHFDSENAVSKPSPNSPEQIDHSDHCHHSHSCFHILVTGQVYGVGFPPIPLLTDYRANSAAGFHSPLFRPPIV